MNLPEALYTAAKTRYMDTLSIQHGLTGLCLMERAGWAVFRHLPAPPTKVCVVTGAGNNAGDGFVVARLAHLAGHSVSVLAVNPPEKLNGDAGRTYRYLTATGIHAQPFENAPLSADVIVDAVLGTGLNREVTGLYRQAIEAINACLAHKIAVDLPSGLDADTGCARPLAVNADVTVSFIGLKRGLLTADGVACCGQLFFDDLQVPASVFSAVASDCQRLSWPALKCQIKPRLANAHKGHFGHVLVIGGEAGFSGAARLAAMAAARTGAGLVSVACRPPLAAQINAQCPELMSHDVANDAQLQPLLQKASVVAIGTGLGQSDWAKALLSAAIACNKPLVMDADALNLLAKSPQTVPQAVFTPHPAEAARLLACDTQTVQADRFAAVQRLQRQYSGVWLLKGAGSLLYAGEKTYLAAVGNAGMASGGMGDVLTGVIAGLLAQGFEPLLAAQMGVMVHGLAADRAAVQGQRGLLASDLLPKIRNLLN